MCGIVGVWSTDATPADAGALCRATQGLAHRGPNDVGFASLTDDGALRVGRDIEECGGPARVWFGHRRLSILDLSVAGWQPMLSADGRYLLVFNGEIYNYVELRRELGALGARFRSHCDTEVLLAALDRWGTGALNRLVGMFAFACLDLQRRRVLLARDPFGIKPLYYSARDGRFAFASEIKALLHFAHVRRLVNPERLHAFLRSGVTDASEDTLLADVRQLPPGHFLDVPLDGSAAPTAARYWRIQTAEDTPLSFPQAADRLRELFLESIRLHLRSDVPLGAALSGGIDSSAIVAAMRHVEPGIELHTFSFTPEDPAISEERWVDVAGGAAGATVHKTRPTAQDLVRDLDALIVAQDEPFGGTSIYAQYCVFRLARERGVTVMLDGQGADEMLAGYPYFMGGRLGALLRRGRLLEARHFFDRARQLPHVREKALLAHAGDALFPRRLRPAAKFVIQRKRALVRDWLNEGWFHERGVRPRSPRGAPAASLLREQLAFSLEHGLPSLLRFEDRNSMAHSIESRVPFLTPQIASFLFSLPDEYIISRDGETKSVFRAAMRGIVPDTILDRRDKIGFQTPERSWLAAVSPWVERVLRSDAAHAIPALNHTLVQEEWAAICSGQRPFDNRAWRWINLIRWAELNSAVFT